MDGAEAGTAPGAFFVAFPSNDGQIYVGVGRKAADFYAYRADIEDTYFATLASLSPEMAARLGARRRRRLRHGTVPVAEFFSPENIGHIMAAAQGRLVAA